MYKYSKYIVDASAAKGYNIKGKMYIWYLYTMLYTVLNNATIVKKPLLDNNKYHGVVWDCAVVRDCVILWDCVDYTEDIVVVKRKRSFPPWPGY